MRVVGHLRQIGVRPGGGYLTLVAVLEWLAGRGHQVRLAGESGRAIDTVPSHVGDPEPHYRWADVAITQLAATARACELAGATSTPLVHYVHNVGQLDRAGRVDLAVFNTGHLAAGHDGRHLVVHPPVWAERYTVEPAGDAILLANPSADKGADVLRELARRMPHRRFVALAGRISRPGSFPPNVEVADAVWDMRPVYAATRLVLMPSKVETYGRVAVEAACSGIPTIAHPTPGLVEALGDAGRFVDRDDVDGWEAAIVELDEAKEYAAASAAARALAANLDPDGELVRLEGELARLVARRVDFAASAGHYLDHLAPTWLALPAEHRGAFLATPSATAAAARHGIDVHLVDDLDGPARRPAVVASDANMRRMARTGRPVILASHGIGQSYAGVDHPSQPGAAGRDAVVLFLHPGDHPAGRDRSRYPTAQVAVVGSPRLDRWHGTPAKRRDDPPTVAVSFHWSSTLAPEATGTFAYYRDQLPDLAGRYRLLGHGHPRAMGELEPFYRANGIEVVHEFDDVLERADLYVCDGISTLYEFAALDRPVVVLNGPHYRRDVEHGLRFWSHVPGVQVDQPVELAAAIAEALVDVPERAAQRRAAVAAAYGGTPDGQAAHRSAAAIMALLERGDIPGILSEDPPDGPWRSRVRVYDTDAHGARVLRFAVGDPVPREEAVRQGLVDDDAGGNG